MTAVERLQNPHDLDGARQALRQVFATPDAGLPRLGPNASARIIIYPVDKDIDVEIRRTIAQARGGGPLRVYITTIGMWEAVTFDAHRHWIVDDLSTADLYDKMDASGWDHLSEYAVYDPQGQWGMLVAFESYAIVVGEPSFAASLRATLPAGVTSGIEPLRVAEGPPRGGIDLSWIDRLEAALADDEGDQL